MPLPALRRARTGNQKRSSYFNPVENPPRGHTYHAAAIAASGTSTAAAMTPGDVLLDGDDGGDGRCRGREALAAHLACVTLHNVKVEVIIALGNSLGETVGAAVGP